MKIEDFKGRGPAFVVERFFAGRATGYGIMQSRFGNLQRQFSVTAEGRWDAEKSVLRLHETYRFDDGQVDQLHWNICRSGPEADGVTPYQGDEVRVVGSAAGEQAGNALHWKYKRSVPSPDGSETVLSFDDWFWLQDERSLVVYASISKIVEIGTMTVFYQRQ